MRLPTWLAGWLRRGTGLTNEHRATDLQMKLGGWSIAIERSFFRLQAADVLSKVQLELADGPKAAFTGFGHLFECCLRPQGPTEDRLRRLKLSLAGQAVLIDDRLGGIQRVAIE